MLFSKRERIKINSFVIKTNENSTYAAPHVKYNQLKKVREKNKGFIYVNEIHAQCKGRKYDLS